MNRAIQDMLKRSNEYIPTPAGIIDYICKYYQPGGGPCSAGQQPQPGRRQLARQIAMYLIRRMTNLSLGDIGKEFGGRDHTTVLHSLDKVEKQMKNRPGLCRDGEGDHDQHQLQALKPPWIIRFTPLFHSFP